MIQIVMSFCCACEGRNKSGTHSLLGLGILCWAYDSKESYNHSYLDSPQEGSSRRSHYINDGSSAQHIAGRLMQCLADIIIAEACNGLVRVFKDCLRNSAFSHS